MESNHKYSSVKRATYVIVQSLAAGCIMQVNLDPELTRSLLFLDEQMLSEDPILSFLFVSIDNLPVLCSDL